MVSRILAVSLCSGALLVLPSLSYASDWTADVVLTQDNEFQHNPSFSETDKEDVLYNSFSPVVTLGYATEKTQLDFIGDVEYNASSNHDVQEDYIRYSIGVEGEYSLENGAITGGLEFEDDSVFNTEFEDTNQFVTDVTRNTVSADVGFRNRISENYELTFSQDYNMITYSDETSYTSYNDMTSRIGLRREMSETLILSSDIDYSLYDPDSQTEDKSHTYGFDFTLDKSFENNSTLTLTTGVEHSESEIGWRLDGTYNMEWERATSSLSLSRSNSPSGEGVLRETNRVEAGFAYAFTESLGIDNSLSYSLSSQAGDGNSNERQSASFETGLSWEVAEDWNLNLQFSERAQKSDTQNDWVHSRTASLSLQHMISYK